MEKHEFLHKFKQINEVRLSGTSDKVKKVHSGTYYRPGKYYEVTAERYNRAGWRDQAKHSQSYRYNVKVFDKEGNHRADEMWTRRESLKKLGFVPGTKRSKKLMLAKEGLKKFEDLKASKIKQEPKLIEGGLRAPRNVSFRSPDLPCKICKKMYGCDCGKNPQGIYLGDIVSKGNMTGEVWAANRGDGVIAVRWGGPSSPGKENMSTSERPIDVKLIKRAS
jgi:hypothetical protein